MKRKFLFIAISCGLLITLSACNNNSVDKSGDNNVNQNQNQNDNKSENQTSDYGELPGEKDQNIPPEYRNDLSMALEGQILDFKAKRLSGEEINKNIFEDSDITIINIWKTEEENNDLKELQKLYSEVKKDGINILGILSNEEEVDEAIKLVESNGVEFTNIVPDESLKSNLLSKVKGMPTTLFVNSKGQIVGDSILGAVSIENYKKALDVAIEHNDRK